MHILEIPSFFTPYGGEFCLEQARALKALGHEVRILSNVQTSLRISGWRFVVQPWGRHWQEMDGVDVYLSYQHGIPSMIRPNVSRWVKIVRSMYFDYVGQYGKPDIIHAHCAKWAGYAAMLISREHEVPYVITEHLPKEILQIELGPAPSSAWQIPLLTESYRQAGMVITVSDEQVEELSCYFGHNYRHQTISNIIDTDYFAYRKRRPLENRPFRFCCPALFVERKGYDILFNAVSRLAECANVQLDIAGLGTDSDACRELQAAYNCQGLVNSHGALDKAGVRQMLYESDALVLATRGESQGLVLLEAMSTGIPAISTEAIPRSVRPGVGCRFVPVDDAKALAEAMLDALHHPVADGEALSDWVRRHASPDVIGRKLVSVFQQVLGS